MFIRTYVVVVGRKGISDLDTGLESNPPSKLGHTYGPVDATGQRCDPVFTDSFAVLTVDGPLC